MGNWQHREKKLQKKSRIKGMERGYSRKDTTTEDSKRLRRQDIKAKIREQEGGIDDVDMEG